MNITKLEQLEDFKNLPAQEDLGISRTTYIWLNQVFCENMPPLEETEWRIGKLIELGRNISFAEILDLNDELEMIDAHVCD